MVANPWTLTSENRYEQKHGFVERFYTRFLSKEGAPGQFIIIGTVEFKVSNAQEAKLESQLRETWRAMRYHSPALAALSGGKERIYQVPDEAALAEWEATTFKRHPHGMNAEELFSTVNRTAMTTLHFLPGAGPNGSHQIALQAEHQNIDGRGVFYFFNRFFTVFTTPSLRTNIHFGDEWTRLPAAMDELLSLPETVSDEEKNIAASWLGPLGSVEPLAVVIDPQHRDRSPTSSVRTNLRLTADETSAVILACKAQGLTVTSAWTAAFALAVAHCTTSADGTALGPKAGIASFSTIDMRRYFPEGFDPSPGHAACYHTNIPVALLVGGGASFSQLAGEMKHELHGGSITAERSRAWAAFFDIGGDIVAAGDQRQSAPLMTSLGVVDDFIAHRFGSDSKGEGGGGVVEVLDVWIADTMMSATQLWMVHTWDGRLNLSCNYNGAYFSEAQILAVLERVREELRSGLGLTVE